ncbi:MAG: TetR family transcriptional regulator [Verrucomicrobiota bacterium]
MPERILEAAMGILATDGVKNLTQPKVAAAAGVRQSHLTYYFPKKTDLVAGLLSQHIDKMEAMLADPDRSIDLGPAFELIANDPGRMRFFMGLIVECERDGELKKLMKEHVDQFGTLAARFFGRDSGDADVTLFLNALRGFGMMRLLDGGESSEVDFASLAKRCGLDS